jgi:hypothetical protein
MISSNKLVQEHSKKCKHLKISDLRETFNLDYAAALKFALTQPKCSVKRDEKHN